MWSWFGKKKEDKQSNEENKNINIEEENKVSKEETMDDIAARTFESYNMGGNPVLFQKLSGSDSPKNSPRNSPNSGRKRSAGEVGEENSSQSPKRHRQKEDGVVPSSLRTTPSNN